MIEETFNLVMAVASVGITLLDPMLQLANGVDLYMEATQSTPLIVSCPPKVENGSWICSERRPLPECYLFCSSGLVPADDGRVDCETYKQDNITNFVCVPAGVVIIGGLNEQDVPVTQVEVFPSEQKQQQLLNHLKSEASSKDLAAQAEETAMISASTELYVGRVVTCGGVYQKSCSSLNSEDFGRGFEAHSVLRNLQEGASGAVLGPRLQTSGSIENNTRSSTEVYTDQEGWTMGTRISQDAYQSCTTRINATHVAVSGGERNQGWLSIVTAEDEVTKVNLMETVGQRWAHGCVAYKGRILIAGGFTGRSSPTASSVVLDLDSMEVRQVGEMKTPRAAFSRLVVMGEHAWAFGGRTGNGTTGSVERFHLERETWEEASWSLSSPRASHTVSSIPTNHLQRSNDITPQDNTAFLRPKFERTVVEGLDNYPAIVTVVLIYVPTMYVCLSNLVKSLKSGYKGLGLRSFSTILLPFPFIQTLISFVTFKIIPEKYLEIIKPSTEEEELDMEEMKAEIQMAGTFYNSCPSICLQILIIITFPNRVLSWIQIGSVTVSCLMTLWTAANLFQLKLERASESSLKEKDETLLSTALSKIKTFLLAAPLILTSLVFNFSNIILVIINNNLVFVLYILAAFMSVLLPATFSPAKSIKELEEKLGLVEETTLTCSGLDTGSGHSSSKINGVESGVLGNAFDAEILPTKEVIVEDAEGLPIDAPNDRRKSNEDKKEEKSECREFMENLTSAFNVAYTNVFCINRPIGKYTPSVRHFMVGLYPLHFVVNMTTLVFERYFSETEVITIRGQIFVFNNVVLVAMMTGVANLIFFILFYYPNFFCVTLRLATKKMYDGMAETSTVASTSVRKRRTYKVARKQGDIEKQDELQKKSR